MSAADGKEMKLGELLVKEGYIPIDAIQSMLKSNNYMLYSNIVALKASVNENVNHEARAETVPQ